MRDAGMGALLADDMGLGKTLQALCVLRGRTLVVAPTSVLHAWRGQIARFRPGLRVATYYGSSRVLDRTADVTITTYGVLRLDQEVLALEDWDSVVLDEAQIIRNPSSQVARAAHRLRGAFRLALTGTPVENRLSDLWSQFQFLNPGLLGSSESFEDTYASPIAAGDRRALERLRTRLKPFVLRRLKREVAAELPPRIETVLHCELSENERDLYQAVAAASRREIVAKLDSGTSVMAALEALLRLRQACCHPALLPGHEAPTSAKIDLLLETLETSLAEGHKALVFSQWTSLLDLVEPHLARAGIRFARLDGSTPDREALVTEFQSDSGPPVMIISLKAGGLGLTLTRADHVFLLDPWWNPAAEDQAADRAHRIGQMRSVLIHRLVAKDTVEEKVLELQNRKRTLAAGVLEGGEAALGITREDILELLT
jgi:SNF2 family DNA or RNA helicase